MMTHTSSISPRRSLSKSSTLKHLGARSTALASMISYPVKGCPVRSRAAMSRLAPQPIFVPYSRGSNLKMSSYASIMMDY